MLVIDKELFKIAKITAKSVINGGKMITKTSCCVKITIIHEIKKKFREYLFQLTTDQFLRNLDNALSEKYIKTLYNHCNCHGLEPRDALRLNLSLIRGSACYMEDGFGKSIGLWIMRGMWVGVWYVIWNGFRYVI